MKKTETITISVEQFEALEMTVKRLSDENAELRALVKWQAEKIESLMRQLYGAKSEKIKPGELSEPEESELPVGMPGLPETEPTPKRKKQVGKRENDLSGLPVVRVDCELPENGRICPICGQVLYFIGINHVCREIVITPAKAHVKESHIHAYACKNIKCEEQEGKQTIVTTDAPTSLIPGSLASPSLVAYIATQKYMMGMPLYRLEKGFWFDGVNISRQTMSNMLIKCYELYLVAIYALLTSHLLLEVYLHADETTLQVLKEPGRKARQKSYEWVYRTGAAAKRKIVIYDYKETREQKHPKNFLANWKGYLHADGYQGYHDLGADIIVVGCWQHARSKFEESWKQKPEGKRKGSREEAALRYINALFELERQFKDLPNDKRLEHRLKQSKPIADAFFAWLDGLSVLPQSKLGVAVTYAKNQREYLMNIFTDGGVEISNNRCERSVKPFVQGRKAWLFSNTPRGAQASSAMFSIAETAKENGLNPFRYFTFLLEKLPNMTTSDNLEDLLPWSDSVMSACAVGH
jgi:transposase